MNLPELPRNSSRTEMRKALIRLRMEMHRQEIRHESAQLLQPLQRVRGMTQSLQDGFGIKHAPLWGVAAVTLLGFLSGKGARKGNGVGSLARLVRLGTTLGPLVKLVLQGSSRKH
ncbi:hypothetical protein F6476_22560 [Pseudomonas umsongensis]|jgi:hypothetical protein|uniref:YqjK-like protein n=1 Tax=Pseudomonas umsongensis TaxID=198618 RepID=A0AAE6ZZQ6_9PSED|nr:MULTISPECIES: hypothetical protein [Pseudomonas]KEX90535.1 hypothetical protein HA62_31325 [Pseudomonas putida]EPA97677.1 hypothetical protein PG5_18640 [Pseudomonas sp. G5(2012)]MBT9572012.1 hypothetical protein [Pseudomonas umsongensis]OXR29816.1 hypothetical protein PSUM_23235 [Pseudomonas umsongensis]QFG31758.1 hypothetical protein F6476_22560 [Pseudomonas umsongensis]